MPQNRDTVTGFRAIRQYNADVKTESELLHTLRKALPSYFDKEGNFLRQRFDHDLKDANISQSRDGYRLDFVGRDYARLQSGLASETMLVPDSKHNAAAENSDSGNLFFTGDNLETLRHLANAYAGKVKMMMGTAKDYGVLTIF